MSTTAVGGYTNSHAAMDTLAAALVNLLANELEYTRYGYAAVDAAGTGDLTLDTTTEEPYSVLYVTGILTGARSLIVSTDAGRRWVVINATTGAYTLTVKTSGGSGIIVTQGYTALLGGNGTDILRLTPDINGSLLVLTQLTDTNGNELVKFTATASAVNELTISNAATGAGPIIETTGGDTNSDVTLRGKGTGGVQLSRSGGKLGFFGATLVARAAALTQTYATADRTLSAYTADNESAAYTGIDNAQGATPYATVADLNALRTAYENLRAFTEDLAQFANALVDDLQSYGLEQ